METKDLSTGHAFNGKQSLLNEAQTVSTKTLSHSIAII